MSVPNIQFSDFESVVLKATTPVLVDLWAPWCGPCKVIGPQVDRVAAENTSSLTAVKIDVQAHPELAKLLEVQNIPTLLVFVDGQVVARKTGAAGGYAAIKALVEPFINAHLALPANTPA